jgi:hypothetical protein
MRNTAEAAFAADVVATAADEGGRGQISIAMHSSGGERRAAVAAIAGGRRTFMIELYSE